MKIKISSILFLTFLLLSLQLITITNVYSKEDLPKVQKTATSSYELFYPLVAGSLPGQSGYIIKTIREKVVYFLIFNRLKKSDYDLVLSQKRIVETESLLKLSQNQNALNTLKKATAFSSEAYQILKTAKKDSDSIKLAQQFKERSQKEVAFLNSLSLSFSKELADPLKKAASQINQYQVDINKLYP